MAERRKAAAEWKTSGVYAAFAVILIAWIAAWLMKLWLDSLSVFIAGSAGSFTYWTLMKLLIWIAPSVYLVRRTGRTMRDIFKPASWKTMLLWSLTIGGFLAILNIVAHGMGAVPVFPASLTFALVNAAVVAPLFEEFTMRGAIFGALRRRYSFWVANGITAILFVLLHVPGWYFAGSLTGDISAAISTVLSIFVIGLLCGLTVERGGSVLGAMIVHFLNNLTA